MSKWSSNIDYLRQYVNGELSPQEMYEIERASHEDEMLQDIISGLEIEHQQQLQTVSSDLSIRINDRVQKNKVKTLFPWKRLSIAASLLVGMSVGAYLFVKQAPQTPGSDPIVHTDVSTSADNTQKYDSEGKNTIQKKNRETVSEQPHIIAQAPTKATAATKTKSGSDQQQNAVDSTRLHSEDWPQITSAEDVIPQIRSRLVARSETIADISQKHDNTETIVIGRTKPQTDSSLYKENLIAMEQRLESRSPKVSSQQAAEYNSITRQRANLQRLHLDPEAQAILNQVLDRKVYQTDTKANSKDEKIALVPDSSQVHTYAAKSKSFITDKEIKAGNSGQAGHYVPDQKDSIALIYSDNKKDSRPLAGWDSYRKYLTQGLSDFANESLKVLLVLQADGTPTHIQIIHSSNEKLSAQVIELIKKGTSWYIGQDSSQVEFEIRK